VNVTLVATTEITDCGYNFIRTWTAVDACGNVAQASQIISLADQEPPVFTYVQADVNLACSDSGSIDDLEMAEASDDCLGLSVLFEDTPLAGNCDHLRVIVAMVLSEHSQQQMHAATQ